MMPKFALVPAASEVLRASAVSVSATDSFSSRAQAAATANMPSVAVECQPFS
jgi:hypothetical protein